MKRGWYGDPRRHSLAARGIKTNSYYGMKERMNSFGRAMLDDKSNPTKHAEVPKFKAESRLQFAEDIRAEVNRELLAAERRGDVNFSQIENFWDNDFRRLYEDYKLEKITAEQFRANCAISVKRVTQPVKVVGVAKDSVPSLLPQKE